MMLSLRLAQVSLGLVLVVVVALTNPGQLQRALELLEYLDQVWPGRWFTASLAVIALLTFAALGREAVLARRGPWRTP